MTAEPGERRRVRYRLRSAPMQVAQQFLAALARDWDGPLGALADHLDRTARGPATTHCGTKPEDIMTDHGFTSVATARTPATAAALTATLGLAAASWVVAVWQMHGMDMGVATRLGSFGFFIAVWVAMMAAMMLPGAAPAVLRRAQASGGVRAVPLFIGSYLAVWALVGVAVYAVYRPHGSVAAGVGCDRGRCVRVHAAQAALPPALPRQRPLWIRVRALLRRLEHRADADAGGAGRHERHLDVGDRRARPAPRSSCPPRAAVDVPLALAIVGLGIWIVIAPSSVPGLMPPM